ncbi:cation-translocating P-type ATPase [Mesomycoplasma conjunctivae]|uniref:cation-translocating P-type ATPase n=1 Tax=Mesomycoplasma conjunctivae TaxID=45361 RepID=UPI003DA57D2E
MKINYENKEDFLKSLNYKQGLTTQQVEFSKEKYGTNNLKAIKEKGIWQLIFNQLKEPLSLILIIVIIISLILNIVFNDKFKTFEEKLIAYLEPVVIFIIIIINLIFSLVQENKTKKALNAIKNLNNPNATVIRNANKINISTSEVVVGDILVINSGDVVSADGLVIDQHNLKMQESMLTGESEAVFKENFSSFDDKKAQVYSGTNVLAGQAHILVNKVGEQTEMGKIAHLVENTQELESPLQKKLKKFTKYIAFLALFFSLIFFFIYIYMVEKGDYSFAEQAIIVSLSLAIGFIPESLIPLITINLIIGVKKLAKDKAIVKDLQTIETLGNISIVCSDKTGTLTENKMVIKDVFVNQIPKDLFWKKALLNTQAFSYFENEQEIFVGDPEEILILQASKKHHLDKKELLKSYQFIDQIPFSSDIKLSAILYKNEDNLHFFVKGAPEVILKYCKNINETIYTKLQQYQNNGLRVFAIASKKITTHHNVLKEQLFDLDFDGFLAMEDPLRQEIPQVVSKLSKAQISTIMITGDSLFTASSIAKQANILADNQIAVSNQEWKNEEKWRTNIENYKVYARVLPADKLEIVDALQNKNHTVAMLGDGVNDAPSLKKANVGFAMGITGTQVSKQVANVVLADDNFSTLYKAIKQGRSVIYNIKQLLIYLLIANFTMLLTVFIGSLIFKEKIFGSLQILWINVVSETFGGIAMSLTSVDKTVMNKDFLDKNKSLVNFKMIFQISQWVLITTAMSLLVYYLNISNPQQASALSFFVSAISLASLSYALGVPTSLFFVDFRQIQYLHLGFLLSLLAIIFVVFVPYVNTIFNMDIYKNIDSWKFVYLLFSLLPFVLDQSYKIIKKAIKIKTFN